MLGGVRLCSLVCQGSVVEEMDSPFSFLDLMIDMEMVCSRFIPGDGRSDESIGCEFGGHERIGRY
jgi:hypothetical protein